MKNIFLSLLIFFLPIYVISNSKNDINYDKKIELLENNIKQLSNKNDSLKFQINNLKTSKDSYIEVVDKIDNLYNNNFDRFIIFWGIVATIIVGAIPYYITQMQKKIIETKKSELLEYSKLEIEKLEEKFSNNLIDKYKELNENINFSNNENKRLLKIEIRKTYINNLFIASKVNELDKNYNKSLVNLTKAAIVSNELNEYSNVNFYLKKILQNIQKFKSMSIAIDENLKKEITIKLNSISSIDEIDQDIIDEINENLK